MNENYYIVIKVINEFHNLHIYMPTLARRALKNMKLLNNILTHYLTSILMKFVCS